MVKKRKEIEFIKPSTGLVSGAVILGAGGMVVGAIPGTTAATAGGGITAAASYMPMMGGVMGAGMTLQEVRKLQKVSKKKRR